MNIWIITIGSSDVQLKHEKNWNSLHGKVRNQLETQKQFSSYKSQDGKRFLYPARIMGAVYAAAIANDSKHYEELAFPLLDNFFWILEGKGDQTKKIIINRAIVIVTDQSEKFKASEKSNPFSAFWQDTCSLQPILKEYFKRKSIEHTEFLILDPDPEKPSGLDNWNDVLERIQEKFKEKFADLKDISKDATIYVSHQAGTPAISSAVQFCSLAKFGHRVKFLVSNEQDATLTDIVKSSAYLRGIEIQQAKKLLEWHDYSGIKEVLQRQIDEAKQLKDEPNPEDEKLKRVASLLDIAVLWNFAKFEDFAKQLVLYPNKVLTGQAETYLKDPNSYWWWEAYEAAYLGVVRLKQDNTVEAMFHSFRSVEGLLRKWVDEKSRLPKIGKRNNRIKLPKKITLPDGENTDKVNAYGQGLYHALSALKDIDAIKDIDIWTFGNSVFDRRNELFHQLGGLHNKDAVFAEWKAPNELPLDEQGWKDRVRNCLNFVSAQKFASIEDASLMAQVHKELVDKIADL